jgi:hypothetical protein
VVEADAGMSSATAGRNAAAVMSGFTSGSGFFPSSQASMILRAIGAAVLAPKPPCSTITATAIVG